MGKRGAGGSPGVAQKIGATSKAKTSRVPRPLVAGIVVALCAAAVGFVGKRLGKEDVAEPGNSQADEILKRAEVLLEEGRVSSAIPLLVEAQELDFSSMRPAEILSAFRVGLGKGIPNHLVSAIKIGTENLERVVYEALYSQGELEGEKELAFRLAKLQMLYHPVHEPVKAKEFLRIARAILADPKLFKDKPSLEPCRAAATTLDAVLDQRASLTAELRSGADLKDVARRITPPSVFRDVDRRSGLSGEEYREKYLKAGRPVIITDFAKRALGGDLGFEEIRAACGDMPVTLSQKLGEARHLWAGLGHAQGNWTLASWIDEVRSGRAPTDHYLMDWGLAGKCEAFLESFRVPHYFTGDLFKRLAFNSSGARDPFQRHPSVFVGAAGSGGLLHVDSFASTFVQILARGRKRWTLFSLPDRLRRALLYAGVEHEIIGKYTSPDERAASTDLPLLTLADEFKVVVEVGPGEMIVVPQDVPHMVENLEDVLAFSMNVLDLPAVPRYREDLEMRACFSDSPAWVSENLRLVSQRDLSALVRGSDTDLPFSAWQTYAPLTESSHPSA